MQFAISVPLTFLLFGTTLFGQSGAPSAQPETFHVRGTIRDTNEGVVAGVEVKFQNGRLSKTVTTNSVGAYEIDLPLDSYTMTARGLPGFRLYRRPLFRPTSPRTVVLNVTLLVGSPCGDMIIVNSSEKPVTDEQRNAATENCRGEELIPVPSGSDLPLELSIRYGSRAKIGSTYSYTGENTKWSQAPVLMDYNLFSMQADKIIYHAQKRTIEASGRVIAVNESGVTRRYDSMTFEIANGQVVPLR